MSVIDETIVYHTHSSHCGGNCLLKLHIKDGVLTRIETDDGNEPQYRACARGRAYRQRLYAPDRILYPLKRIGDKGEGKFVRISWDEGLDTVARELRRVRETYGPASILFRHSGGDVGTLHRALPHFRLLALAGGCSETWGIFSFEAGIFAELVTLGTANACNTRDNLLNSRLIIMWGWNPAVTVQDTNTSWYLAQAREAGIRIVSVDPRYTASAATFSDEWIPIVPGTDAAMLIAMAHVIIKENLHDQGFLDACAIGFDQFKAYVLGEEDGVPKTPAWAEPITGVPSSTIASLAKEYASMKPAALIAGIAAGRTAYGEQYHRAAMALAAMTGNIGVRGGDAAGISWAPGLLPFLRWGQSMEVPNNPVESAFPPRKYALTNVGTRMTSDDILRSKAVGLTMRRGQMNSTQISDAIIRGRTGGYPADYKLLYQVDTSYPNQYLNVNKAIRALKSLEFQVVFEQFMNPGARFADIVLPSTTCLERNDFTVGGATGLYGYMNKAVEPLGESKSHLEICTLLAAKMGISDFNDKTEDEWLRQIVKGSCDIPDYDQFKHDGIHKLKLAEPYVAFKKQVDDPENNPFPTPSGKIEIYSQRLADMNTSELPPIPKYIEAWEGRNDSLARRFPLQLVTTHNVKRAHSQYHTVPWLKEVEKHSVSMNTDDAKARGIADGDTVRVFNDRGQIMIIARVTEGIMPGVVDIPQGTWYDPDEKGIDRGGCANTLTKDAHSPGGAFCTNTALVEVAKFSKPQ
jgi:anaerobic dimethyl sulfoxide reductase subunit A